MKRLSFISDYGKEIVIRYKESIQGIDIISVSIFYCSGYFWSYFTGKQLTHKRQLTLIRYAEARGARF